MQSILLTMTKLGGGSLERQVMNTPCDQKFKKNFKIGLSDVRARLSLMTLFGLIGLLAPVPATAQKFEELAKTPPMGWNSWNHFDCDIDETLVRETADAMVKTGLRDAGYEYVNLDDCWHGKRDKDGFIQPDPKRFPSGIKALADYVHKRGLKLGIYSDAGTHTCQKKPGSQGYEYQDALQYARWGVDYLKYDWCNTGEGKAQRNPIEAYTVMRDAIKAAGRPMVFSVCEWGQSEPWTWAKDIGHLWRTTGDIINCWDCSIDHGTWDSHGILPILDMQKGKRAAAGPGHWNDPDMLEVGNLPTLSENRAHFAMWAMLAAPLIVGTDFRNLSQDIIDVLTNKAVIAVNQDKLGIQGFTHRSGGEVDIWVKPLSAGDWAIAFLNRSDFVQSESYNFYDAELEDYLTDRTPDFKNDSFTMLDLWTGENAGTLTSQFKVTIAPRDVRIFRMKKG